MCAPQIDAALGNCPYGHVYCTCRITQHRPVAHGNEPITKRLYGDSYSGLDYRFTIKHDEDDADDDVIDDEDVFLFFSHVSKTTSWVDPRTQSKESTSATERSHHHSLFFIQHVEH